MTVTREVHEVDEAPGLTGMLARAVVTGVRRSGDALPETTIVQREVATARAHLADYAEVCGFPVADVLPATWLHMLAFPLSVHLMTGKDFPFPLVGLVHVANRITHHRPVGADERVDLAVHLADLRPHARGRQFDVVAEARAGDALVWSSVSTYLRRGKGSESDAEVPGGAASVDVTTLPMTSRWTVPADIGRRYGAVSGDRNPIHMASVTARAFGFPRAIAHGMWSKARCLAGLEGRLPDAWTVDVAFRQPVLLPSTVDYATAEQDGGWAFGLRSRDRVHLAGLVTPLD